MLVELGEQRRSSRLETLSSEYITFIISADICKIIHPGEVIYTIFIVSPSFCAEKPRESEEGEGWRFVKSFPAATHDSEIPKLVNY